MVSDGYYYGLGFGVAALILGWLTAPLWALPAVLLACFFLWFFRDPERDIPALAGAVVSPGDGKGTDVSRLRASGADKLRISIFLSGFDVHVNRPPLAGGICDIRYQRGKFINAMNED